MRAVNKFPFVTEVYGLGVFFDEGAAKDNFELDYKNMYLLGRRMPHVYSTNFLRQVFTFCEFLLRASFFIIVFRPTVVHAHDTVALMAARVARLFINFKLIYDAHELMPHKQGVTKITSWAIGVFERFSWSKIDQFITVGFKIKDWYLATYGNKIATVIFNSPTPSEKQLLLLEKIIFALGFRYRGRRKFLPLLGCLLKAAALRLFLIFSPAKIMTSMLYFSVLEIWAA